MTERFTTLETDLNFPGVDVKSIRVRESLILIVGGRLWTASYLMIARIL